MDEDVHYFFPPYRRPHCTPIQIIIFGVIASVFICSLVGLALYFRANSPTLQITRLVVTTFYLANKQLTAIWDIQFNVKNYCQRSVSYENVKVSVYYRNDGLLSSSLIMPSFDQPRRSRMNYQAIVAAMSTPIPNYTMDAIADDCLHGTVAFNLRFHADVVVDRDSFLSTTLRMTAVCNNVEVQFYPGTTTGFLPRAMRCDVTT